MPVTSTALTAAPIQAAGTPLDQAILRAVLYADIFEYPLTPVEIHFSLPGRAATLADVHRRLALSPWLADRLAQTPDGYVSLRGRPALAARRAERARHSARLWPAARRWAGRLARLPFVRLVAVTGSLAVDNAPAGADIDFLIVTEPGRVWLTRALAVVVVRAARLTGVQLCPNYVLARSALAQPARDFFVAHDLLQMVPLAGQAVYAEMRAANPWVAAYLPQAACRRPAEIERAPRGLGRWLQRAGERLLGGRLGDMLEAWERTRKLRKFAPAAARPGAAAQLDAEHVKGHFDDHGRVVLAAYRARLARFGLTAAELE